MTKYSFRDLVIDSRTGLNPRKNFKLGNGENYYITIKDIHDGKIVITEKTDRVDDTAISIIKKRSRIKNGDVLFTSIGRIGETAIVEDKDDTWDVNESVFIFTLNTNIITQEYFCALMQSRSVQEQLQRDSSGSTFKSIKMNQLEQMCFYIPQLSVQREIIAKLNKVRNVITKRKEQLHFFDELVKSRFIEMFGGVHDSKIYPYKAVKELTDVVSGGTPSRDISEYWEEGTIPWVKTTELQNNIVTEVEEYITEQGLSNSSAKIVPSGTVLIAMYGQGKTRGMTAYLGIKACTNQACACILPSDKINQTFLWQFFVLSYDKLRDMAKGGNQPNLNGNMIKNFPILCPPRELQEQFATFVEHTDKSKLEIQKSLEKLETLKKALMEKYFG